MVSRDGFHSRLVAWLKILLPLVALALLSTLFLLSQGRNQASDGLTFAQLDLQERAREEVITKPRFSGASANGHLISFVAEAAKPDPEANHLAYAQTLSATINLTSGTKITFAAGAAEMNTMEEVADLSDGVTIISSTGYNVQSDTLRTLMADVGAETFGPVTGIGPPGRIDAGKLLLTSDPTTGEVQLLFTNGVKLLYHP